MKASQCARPMVNAGNRMWNEITKPNWIRDNSNGDCSSSSTHVLRGTRECAAPDILRVDGFRTGFAGSGVVVPPMTGGRSAVAQALLPCAKFVAGTVPMPRLLPLSAALLLSANALAQAPTTAPVATGSTTISLEQAMADPDRIGPPFGQASCAWARNPAQTEPKLEGD